MLNKEDKPSKEISFPEFNKGNSVKITDSSLKLTLCYTIIPTVLDTTKCSLNTDLQL